MPNGKKAAPMPKKKAAPAPKKKAAPTPKKKAPAKEKPRRSSGGFRGSQPLETLPNQGIHPAAQKAGGG